MRADWPDQGKAMIARIRREHPDLDFKTQAECSRFLAAEYPGCQAADYGYFFQRWQGERLINATP